MESSHTHSPPVLKASSFKIAQGLRLSRPRSVNEARKWSLFETAIFVASIPACHEDFTRLPRFGGGHDTLLFEFVDQPGGSRIADVESALQQGRRYPRVLHCQFPGGFVERVFFAGDSLLFFLL